MSESTTSSNSFDLDLSGLLEWMDQVLERQFVYQWDVEDLVEIWIRDHGAVVGLVVDRKRVDDLGQVYKKYVILANGELHERTEDRVYEIGYAAPSTLSKFAFPIIWRQFSPLIVNELVSIQPIQLITEPIITGLYTNARENDVENEADEKGAGRGISPVREEESGLRGCLRRLWTRWCAR